MNYQHQTMSSEEFQAIYQRINHTGNHLLKYLQELRAGRLQEGDDTKGLQSVEDEISKAIEALKAQKYQVAVIAAMKAGKSTFLNSLIGADVLASESEACTVCRTDIRPIEAGQTPRLLEFREGERHPVVVAEGEAEEIRQKFLDRTHEIRVTKNQDNTMRFQLEHPIQALNELSSLTGFTLLDTPGPNEFATASFNTVALKQTALEALRTSDAILFILDYTSFRDDINAELLQDLIEQRSEFLANNTGKIYFILNKVDRKAEKDRPIEELIADLTKVLIEFGIPDPIVYSASAWQGLLAKLIQKKAATKEHKADFKNFFLARYIEEDEDGEVYVPKMADIAPKALQDSGIKTIETSVIQRVVQNSGWNLLSDVLAKLSKAAQAIEETLMTEIKGWEMELGELQLKIEEYKQRSDSARKKVENVKKSVAEQKQLLISEFSQGVQIFAESAKIRLKVEIDKVAQNQSKKPSSDNEDKTLFSQLWGNFSSLFEKDSSPDPYKIRCKDEKEAQKLARTINEYCTPVIHRFWLDTQDKLIREGTRIREGIVERIKEDIQAISDELSEYIGNALQVDISTNPIQFPDFEFLGIDAMIKEQQKVIARIKKEKRKKKGNCCTPDEVYYVDVPYEEKVSYYEVDLLLTLQQIENKIDEQVKSNLELLQRLIQKQVKEDFSQGEQQIKDYINRFQSEFDQLLKQRATREVEAPEIIAKLEIQKAEIIEYVNELTSIRELLDSRKPTTR
jgi:GTPase Era involved in 16S rRNA processing